MSKEKEIKSVERQKYYRDLINQYIMEGEVFKPIKDFEQYHIGSHGHILSYKSAYPVVLTPFLDGKGKYYMITLCNEAGRFKKLVHRLVAQAFLANPNNLPEVNHIKSNETWNNHVDNLEWCTDKYNTTYAYQTLPPDRNRRSCILVFPDGSEKFFESYADIRRYHDEHNLDFSKDSLNYNGKSRGFKLIKLGKTSNKDRKGLNLGEINIPENENYREVML